MDKFYSKSLVVYIAVLMMFQFSVSAKEDSSELIDDSFVGSWPMFGTDLRMKIGGYFKVDLIKDFDGTTDKDQFLISKIPVKGTPNSDNKGYFHFTVRETRFNFDIRNTKSDIKERVFLEMDFFDATNTSPRLRHAYIEYGNLVVGQTWTNLSELNSLPFMIDFAYGDALYGGRTKQIRWQDKINSKFKWAAAFEQITEAGIDNPYNLAGAAIAENPSVSARIDFSHSRGFNMLGASVSEISWDGQGTGKDASIFQWSAVFAGRQYFLEKRTFSTWNISYGDGTAANVIALAGSNANAVLKSDGTLATNKVVSVSLGQGYTISETLSANLAYAWTELTKSTHRSANSMIGGSVLHINLVKQLSKRAKTGLEYMWGERKNNDGKKGDANRIQTMLMYNF
ncbi:DcaP family trimeric outer membrane transporter [Halobacteriovorax sp. HLS]|uniref:DcaP family trimeric outer membrane transporter n=1 Tax=Halobacteriovorax sp. HLS TaxID=2234000 RepID=UPI000FD9B3BC|nr:DcaP family trimeric outer membrane transporter [Halobacteriovorax sp. HLS]